MIRRTRTLIFLSAILASSVLLGLSTFYQADTYRSLSFSYEITAVNVTSNATSGTYTRVQITGRIQNPGLTLSVDLIHTDTNIFLNGEQLYYGFGFKGSRIEILPGASRNFSWEYSLTESDQTLFTAAESSGNWNWVLLLEPLVQTTFLAETNNGRLELSRFVFYFGANILPL